MAKEQTLDFLIAPLSGRKRRLEPTRTERITADERSRGTRAGNRQKAAAVDARVISRSF
jgi:hypothetical protein